jgi:NAD-dependent SIR2 family protein deacetylase
VDELKEMVCGARSITVLTGAGISAESVVQSAASFAFQTGELGAKILEFNVEHTPISRIAKAFVGGKSGETLPMIIPVKD